MLYAKAVRETKEELGIGAAPRTRFAPSPTGDLHLGHARTHLLAWLLVKQRGGSVVMRIEDLDPPRVVAGSADRILADHEWLGLTWDEGPTFQSTRAGAYNDAIEKLGTRCYRCTCSRKEIVASAPHGASAIYPGTCREGPTHPERDAALRFRFTSRGYSDLFVGDVAEERDGDFVVRRKDGVHAYQLAVVVDDANAKIDLVVRGEDLVPSTPRQLALYDALGLPAPRFLHVPLAQDHTGVRFAKRAGSISIAALRDRGLRKERILGALGQSLGVPGRETSLEALLGSFRLAAVPREPVRFDANAL